jgi:hypothetical protein
MPFLFSHFIRSLSSSIASSVRPACVRAAHSYETSFHIAYRQAVISITIWREFRPGNQQLGGTATSILSRQCHLGVTAMKSKLRAMLAISGAIVILSAYSANAGFITQADFGPSVISDLNDLSGSPEVFPTPFTSGIYTFTTDTGGLPYERDPLNGFFLTPGDLGWIRIAIDPRPVQ